MDNVCNKIIDGISIKLDEIFNKENDKYAIYGEEIKQGLEEPCFFIKLLISSIDQIVGNRYYRTLSFDIHYFPENKLESEKEMLNIVDELYIALEYITCNDELFRGTNMRHEIIDGVLHFFVDYNFYSLRKKAQGDYIENLDYKGEVSHG